VVFLSKNLDPLIKVETEMRWGESEGKKEAFAFLEITVLKEG